MPLPDPFGYAFYTFSEDSVACDEWQVIANGGQELTALRRWTAKLPKTRSMHAKNSRETDAIVRTTAAREIGTPLASHSKQ